MADRKHRRGGRTTPKGTRPGDRPERPSVVEAIVADSERMVAEIGGLAEAESWASGLMTVFDPVGFGPPLCTPVELLRAAGRRGGLVGAAVAEAMALYGPMETRVKARKTADRLAGDLERIPAWLHRVGRVDVGRTWLMRDIWGDGGMALVEYTDAEGATWLAGCEIDSIGGVMATSFGAGMHLAEVEGLVAGDPHTELVEVDGADAGATVAAAMAERAATVAPDPEDADPQDDLAPLVAHRFSLLPEGGTPLFAWRELDEADRSAMIDRFVAHSAAVGLDDADIADADIADAADAADIADAVDIAGTICDFAGFCDGDPLCWSPARVDAFLGGWVPRKVVADDEWFRNLPVVLRAWLRFAAAETGLRDDGLEIVLAQVDTAMGLLHENRFDPAQRSATTNIVMAMQDDSVDLMDKAAVDAWIEAYNRRPRDERF